jgi:flagellar biosynthetic protein FliR
MHGSLTFPLGLIASFLLVFARVSGLFVFVPLPGMKQGPDIARVMLALCITFALLSKWPAMSSTPSLMQLTGSMLLEGAIGITIGIGVAIVLEVFVLTAQFVGMNAGYGFASTIDPNTQADSGILLVLAQLFGGMLFFSLGLDRQVMQVLASSLERHPAGSFSLQKEAIEQVAGMGADMFSTGFRLALPAVAILIVIDITLAMLGRMNAQLQLVSLTFPIKMMVAIAVLVWIATLFPKVLSGFSGRSFVLIRHMVLG